MVVKLNGIRNGAGDLRASLYQDPESFRKEEKALAIVSIPASRSETTLTFKEVPTGRYAIMVYHDENSDGRLNLRLDMFPTEGYGLSRNPTVFGPPRFVDSAFEHGEPGHVEEITLKY